ncbi:MAG: ATP-binding protein [Saprospiraceae bacterium]|nr:ATP-binding protein [Saprospiraceae bacterium]
MLLKTQISEAFERQQTQFQNKSLGQERSILNSINTTSGEIIIVTGARRVGKSTLLKQLAGKAENIAFVNFEDPLLFGFELSDFGKLDEVMGEQAELLYLFDEVQVIKQWEIFVRNLHDRQKKIVITGSNASLLSKELGTRLTGRHHTVELFPFSYHEYCTFLNLISSTNTFKTYLETGGFPQYVKNQSTEYLNQLLLDILNRDIAIRYGVRNTETRRLLENAIFLQLRRKYKTVFYFKEKKECDFVIPQKDRTYLLIQVCYELHVDNKDREINGLIEALHFFDQKEGFIITMDQKDELKKRNTR